MSCLLWFRPAHAVRFTSLRDMSLHRNRPPALRADATSQQGCNIAFMRGLRA
ncbi:MAG: hypothetical protein ABIX46_10275 [Burkholderiaceae bacterium]